MKAKIEKIIKEIIRNEAISTDKLKMLAKKEGLNQKRITYVMRQAGVLKIMGQGVYQVLIHDKNTDGYIMRATEVMEADIQKRSRGKKKKEKLDMYSKLLEMINTFMDKVQTNTNKQNEYIAQLDKKVDGLEILLNNEIENVFEKIIYIEKQIDSIERNIRTVGNDNSGVLKALHQLLGEIV